MNDEELLQRIKISTDPITGVTTVTMPDPRMTQEELDALRDSVRQIVREELARMRKPT